MKLKQYADITEIINLMFGGSKQKFADYRKVHVTQVRRWIAKNGHILDGNPDGIIFVKSKINKQKECLPEKGLILLKHGLE